MLFHSVNYTSVIVTHSASVQTKCYLLLGVNHGHTGHVRFLTSVELGPENGGGVRGPLTTAAARPGASTTGGDARLPIRKDNSSGTAKIAY